MRQNKLQTHRARRLRRDMTDCERILWFALRDRRLMGLKFRRQVPVGPFIADFYCAETRLILEADGAHHNPAADAARDAYLSARGYRTLRLTNHDILTNLPGTLARIAEEATR
jgi:very-short-patch-repair endonuclease